MTDDDPKVPVICPECETTTRIPIDDLAESIERHNDQLHDGEEVAHVDPDLAEQLADIVAEDMDLL
jgi:hypothetical protein